jgi:phosphate transport system protein
MRSRFDEQLLRLNDLLIEMGGLVETAISLAIEALRKQDTGLAEKAIEFDREVDQKEKDIEALCLKLLLQQQPVAGDLRLISAALKMITDMERIGDQAADISEITITHAATPYAREPEHITQMAAATVKMVTESIDAFVKRDLELAKAVIAYDDVVDDLFYKVRDDLLKLLCADSPENAQAIDLLMVAKYFERIGDHAENIAEWVVFSITGKHEYEK